MSRLQADLLLLLAALIWGSAFVAQKLGTNTIGPLLFVGGRFMLSALLLAPLAWRESRGRKGRAWRDWPLAGAIGAVLCIAVIAQQVGLVTTSVTDAGFITALYIAFVPFAAWLILRTGLRPLVLAAVAVSLAGAWLLAGHGPDAGGLSLGDFLLLAAAILYALHIVLVSIFLKRAQRPYFLSWAQYSVTAIVAVVIGLAVEPVSMKELENALPAMLYTGILSGGVGYTLQIVAQRHTPATEAALIMSLESVFAAIAGAIWLGDRLTVPGALGCLLILSGVVMVEVIPVLSRRGPTAEDPPIGVVPLD